MKRWKENAPQTFCLVFDMSWIASSLMHAPLKVQTIATAFISLLLRWLSY
jgi:hypothetical protein